MHAVNLLKRFDFVPNIEARRRASMQEFWTGLLFFSGPEGDAGFKRFKALRVTLGRRVEALQKTKKRLERFTSLPLVVTMVFIVTTRPSLAAALTLLFASQLLLAATGWRINRAIRRCDDKWRMEVFRVTGNWRALL